MAQETKKISRDEYDNIILVVEEEKRLRDKILELLSHTFPNCTVLTCNNGLDALKTLKKGHAHVVITEWEMKPMSGINLLKALRFQFTKETLPIMMLTARHVKEDMYDFYNHGGNFFMKKPFRDDDFITKIEKMLLLKTMVKMVGDLQTIEGKVDDIISIFEKCVVTGAVEGKMMTTVDKAIEDLRGIKSFSDKMLKEIKEKEEEEAKKEKSLV